QAFPDRPIASVALLAGACGRDQTIAFHRGSDRPRIRIKYHCGQLPGSCHLAVKPPGGSWRHVAGYTFNGLVRRPSVRSKLGLHHVTALAAELNGFHMLDCPITYLTSNEHVRDRHHTEKDGGTPPRNGLIR